ncbi:phenylacetyl-CoA ligase [Fomes fomentarius]|nr:phenylacetyl-CoA ligase [Fomes fomentarius]
MTLFESRDPLLVFPRDDLTVPQFILDESNAHPTKPIRPVGVPCLIDEVTGKTMHLPELQSRSHALARALKGRWSIVSIYSPNELDYPIVAWAVQRLGATLAAHSAALTADELVHQLKIARPALLVTHPGVLTSATTAAKRLEIAADRLVLLEGHLAPDVALPSIGTLINEHEKYPPYAEHCIKPGEAKTAVAFLYFSSGTTGNPKASMRYNIQQSTSLITQPTIASTRRISKGKIGATVQETAVAEHCPSFLTARRADMYGMIQVNYSVFTAMSVVLSRAFNYEQFLRSIEQYRISHLMVVPPHVVLLCKHPLTKKFNLSSVRVCFVSAAPLSAELTEELLRVLPGIELGQGYGLTEATGGVALVPVSQRIGTLGSAGQLLSGTVAKVVKPDGTLAGVGERGEIYIQGPQVALGYLGAEEAIYRAAETFVDGWLRTGDEVLFNEDGDLFITDRIKELIKVKGLQVAPSELEGRLLNHPYIADAGVIGVPHDYAGEVPRAYVVLKPDIAAAAAGDSSFAAQVRDELYKHVSATTAKYKWLEGGIEIVEAIPKSPSGKILRRILKEQSLSSKSSVAGKSRL